MAFASYVIRRYPRKPASIDGSADMPPREAAPVSPEERRAVIAWAQATLDGAGPTAYASTLILRNGEVVHLTRSRGEVRDA